MAIGQGMCVASLQKGRTLRSVREDYIERWILPCQTPLEKELGRMSGCLESP
ncbi:hypothetical protein M0804_004049 [Polistes exclamans]|nr:hypothetical protein M0804_004049 [Polistes exclamans]